MVEKFTIEIARDGSITVTPPPKPRHTAEDLAGHRLVACTRTIRSRRNTLSPVANPTHRMSHGRVQLRVACQKRDRGP